jgi:tetratricopeptide (TPR) repeat protein
MNRTAAKTWIPRLLFCWLSLNAGSAWPQTAGAPASDSPASTTPPEKYSDLIARSGALTPEQKAKAQELFSTGFTLWQAGDFPSAAKAFQDGLNIDPANGSANYYLGDCLQRSHHQKEAVVYFGRASAMGTVSPEKFKAKAAFDELSRLFWADNLSLEDVKSLYVGTWFVTSLPLNPNAHFMIYRDKKGELEIQGTPCPKCGHYMAFVLDGNEITFQIEGGGISWRYHLVDARRLEGVTNMAVVGRHEAMIAIKKD